MSNLLALTDRITNPALGGKALNRFETSSPEAFLQKLIPSAVGLLLVFGGAAFFFMLIIGSVSWIMSSGDKGKIESARSRITSALVGLVLMICTFAITILIEKFFKVNILTIDIGPLVIQ